jgi:thioredoxin-related protein
MSEPKSLSSLKDLRTEFAHIKKFKIPLILLLSRSDCRFCHEVKTNYLSPLSRTTGENRIVIRELVTDIASNLIDGDGKPLPMKELLKFLKVNFFPTVVFINHQMQVMAEPLIGLNQSGFYGAYLDQRIEIALRNAALNE